jgi:hypothetical protein
LLPWRGLEAAHRHGAGRLAQRLEIVLEGL